VSQKLKSRITKDYPSVNARESRIDLEKVRAEYDEIAAIWDDHDRWHKYTQYFIKQFIDDFWRRRIEGKEYTILNAGSGGNDYGLKGSQVHVDIAASRLRNTPNSLVSSIEEIPLDDNQFDLCLCVGSVINYCDAVKAVQEFGRLLKAKGLLMLEFENSRSFEFLLEPSFGQSAYIVETFYQNRVEEIWVFSETYVKSLLEVNGFKIIALKRFHIISPLVYRLTKNPNFSSAFAVLDGFARFVPCLRRFSSNIILVCERNP
jgi:SAM-dependent methyltransferase